MVLGPDFGVQVRGFWVFEVLAAREDLESRSLKLGPYTTKVTL